MGTGRVEYYGYAHSRSVVGHKHGSQPHSHVFVRTSISEYAIRLERP